MISLLVACAEPEPADTAPAAPALPALVINEIAPRNTTLADAGGNYSDWIELYNAGEVELDLGVFYLNEYPSSVYRQEGFPSGDLLPPGAFRLVWCGGYVPVDTGASDSGESYVGFQLDGTDGESISLVWGPDRAVDGVLLETWTFGATPAGVSLARVPDGAVAWRQAVPTPGVTNGSAP